MTSTNLKAIEELLELSNIIPIDRVYISCIAMAAFPAIRELLAENERMEKALYQIKQDLGGRNQDQAHNALKITCAALNHEEGL